MVRRELTRASMQIEPEALNPEVKQKNGCLRLSNTRSEVVFAPISKRSSTRKGVLLGEAADHSDIALDPDMILGVLSTGDFSSESSQLISAQYQLPMWQALVAITRRSYWRRAWVMQEVALAQGLINVMYQESAIQKIRHIVQELSEFELPHYKNEPDPLHGAHLSKKRLFDLLLDCAHKECSDPRDKIFSLLAMAADTKEGDHPARENNRAASSSAQES
ncbi:uncharacterized protein PV07_03358 [Cladophialophora immunda]|uniref:Heterokaryon incompatibility domain-containing protein n=1 Tax=Cladophialophora immunda TaxID=569365 RepID=A0A0D1ZUG0_9EURO|nr:uncharacterized protein PV07_03358 [Cladophialophora immunda]KIW31761.1 hypothetical protein PV07_03358 [Cladophialophora immunda]